ncbi:hypothetical protein GCM10011504_17250 [Siccirubricoccus deserti]|nr:hypothetical protein GCM10011504_17250 [Siccirubricoccus deserti]
MLISEGWSRWVGAVLALALGPRLLTGGAEALETAQEQKSIRAEVRLPELACQPGNLSRACNPR